MTGIDRNYIRPSFTYEKKILGLKKSEIPSVLAPLMIKCFLIND